MPKKKHALFPSEREKECEHSSVHYTGPIPCTGTVRCDLCGTEWDTMKEAKESAR